MLNRTRLERLLAFLEAIKRAANPKPRNVLEVSPATLDDPALLDAAVAMRVAELEEHSMRGGLLIVPGMATPEEWDAEAESALSVVARASQSRPEHADARPGTDQ